VISSRQLGERLADARKRSGLTQAEVAGRVGFARTTLVAIEKGERRPTNAELVRLAELVDVAVHDLLREHRPLGQVSPRFRLLGDATNDPSVQAGVDRLRTFARKYVELERILASPRPVARLELVRTYQEGPENASLEPRLAGRDAAATIRGLLGLGDAPFLSIDDRLETEAGLRLFYLDHLPAQLSALLLWGDDIGACVGINRAHPVARQRWSIAHEFGHFLRDREAGDVFVESHLARDPAEVFSNTFTAELLLPEAGIARLFNDRRRARGGRFTPVDLASLARYFEVSFEAMGRRLEEVDLLPVGTHEKLLASRQRLGVQSLAAAPPAVTAGPQRTIGVPQRYLTLAVAAYDQALISESDFADFLGTDIVTARVVHEEATGVALDDGSLLESLSSSEDLTR